MTATREQWQRHRAGWGVATVRRMAEPRSAGLSSAYGLDPVIKIGRKPL